MLVKKLIRLVVVALLACMAPLVQAHAILISSTPAAKSEVSGPDLLVSLRFNSRIDAKRSRLILVSPSGTGQLLSIAANSAPDALEAPVKGLKSGAYILRWQVLAVDGHITRGEIPFSVR
jgi:methionine-rich copper-binding protein CopC